MIDRLTANAASPLAPSLRLGDADDARESFASILGRQRTTRQTPQAQARESAEQFVAIALIQPVLKQLRESSSKMLKMAVQQGRSKQRGEEVHTTLRAYRSPVE